LSIRAVDGDGLAGTPTDLLALFEELLT